MHNNSTSQGNNVSSFKWLLLEISNNCQVLKDHFCHFVFLLAKSDCLFISLFSLFFKLEVKLNLRISNPENFSQHSFIDIFPHCLTKEKYRMGKRLGKQRRGKKKKKSVAYPCSSKTSNKFTSKESLVVSHNMVKLEIAGNQLN